MFGNCRVVPCMHGPLMFPHCSPPEIPALLVTAPLTCGRCYFRHSISCLKNITRSTQIYYWLTMARTYECCCGAKTNSGDNRQKGKWITHNHTFLHRKNIGGCRLTASCVFATVSQNSDVCTIC